jgi:hypothetical protein
MANLHTIQNVFLYTALTESAGEQYLMYKALQDAGIKFTVLAYNDHLEGQKATLEALSTWYWGSNGTATITFTNFPIVHWEEHYDDNTKQFHCIQSVEEFANSTLLSSSFRVR